MTSEAIVEQKEKATSGLLQPDTGKRLQVSRKSVIFREKHDANAIYLIHQGLVKSSRINKDGVEQITHFHFKGDLVGIETLTRMKYATNAIATRQCELQKISRAELLQEAAYLPFLNRYLAKAYLQSQEHMFILNKTRAATRLAGFLLHVHRRLSDEDPGLIAFGFSRTDIAHYLGLSVETVCRELKKLKLDRTISIKQTKIRILDFQRLSHLANH